MIGRLEEDDTSQKMYTIQYIDLNSFKITSEIGYKGGLIGCAYVKNLRLIDNTIDVTFGDNVNVGGIVGYRDKIWVPGTRSDNNFYNCDNPWLGGGEPITETYNATVFQCLP